MGVRELCGICNREFSDLDKHMRRKHSTNPRNNPDPLQEYVSESHWDPQPETLHQEKQESDNKKYCHECCKWFSNLNQHMKIVHSGVKNYSCQNCQKKFYDNRERIRHLIKYLRTGECKKDKPDVQNKFVCDLCAYSSNKKSNLIMHKESVHLNIKYACPECSKELSSRANLNSHMKNVHNKKIKCGDLEHADTAKLSCKLCSYSTSRSGHLDRHMLSVHSAAAFETVEQVYQESNKQGQASSRVASHTSSSGSRLPQFAHLVKTETGDHEAQQAEPEVQPQLQYPISPPEYVAGLPSLGLSYSPEPEPSYHTETEDQGIQRLILPLLSDADQAHAFPLLSSSIVLPVDNVSPIYLL